jgi:hypothetical protein
LFSNNSVNNNPDNADKDEEEDEDNSYKGENDPNHGKSIGSLFCAGPEIDGNVHHVHVVMNHNPQEESMGIKITGFFSPHLAFFMTLPWALSVSLLFSIFIFQFV